MLGCDGANSLTCAIGAHMYGLLFTQDGLVIDVNTDVDLGSGSCHQLCNPERAAPTCGCQNPLPLGIPAGQRDRSRLPEPGRRRAADQAGWATPGRRVGAGGATAYTFRAQVAVPLARSQRVPPGDAAPPDPASSGRVWPQAARRDEPDLKLVGASIFNAASVLDTYEQDASPCGPTLMAAGGAAMTAAGVGDLIRPHAFPRMQNLRLPGPGSVPLTASHPVCAVRDW